MSNFTTTLRVRFNRPLMSVRLSQATGSNGNVARTGAALTASGKPSEAARGPGMPQGLGSNQASGATHTSDTPDALIVARQTLAVCQQIQNGVSQLAGQIGSLHQQLQASAMELAVAATEAVLNKSVNEGSISLDGVILQLVEQLDGDTVISVYLNPGDHANLLKAAEQPELSSLLSNLKLVATADIPRGTCRVANSITTVRTDLLTRLAAIRERWMESLDDARTGHRSTDTVS